jgi:apolipoprotein N-acyltransferase
MAKPINASSKPLGWKKSFFWLGLAVACFNAAYVSLKYPAAGLLMVGYAFALVRMADQPSVRRAFYFGLTAGFLCDAPQLYFFWNIFSAPAVVLWLLLAFWIGLFTAIVCGAMRRWGKARAVWLIPIVWTGLEYFRSELYYLKFSWLNVGYACPNFQIAPFNSFGMYGVGFVAFSLAAFFSLKHLFKKNHAIWLGFSFLLLVPLAWLLQISNAMKIYAHSANHEPISLVGIQMEFPAPGILPKALDVALAKNTNAPIFVLSEYTLDGPVPDSLKGWCRKHSRFVVVGGKDLVGTNDYYDTAFVVGTNGDIVFRQGKAVPIQFFRDGLPAPGQNVWNSPWGKIGFCVCYDLSYTRVTDELVRQGAQLLIVPTMDVMEWSRHEHELHFRVAPVRAAEYGIPIFRLASSGISQAVSGGGKVVATAPMPGGGEILVAQLRLPLHGSLPLDRWLAPFCTGITALVMVSLLLLELREKRFKSKDEAANQS